MGPADHRAGPATNHARDEALISHAPILHPTSASVRVCTTTRRHRRAFHARSPAARETFVHFRLFVLTSGHNLARPDTLTTSRDFVGKEAGRNDHRNRPAELARRHRRIRLDGPRARAGLFAGAPSLSAVHSIP